MKYWKPAKSTLGSHTDSYCHGPRNGKPCGHHTRRARESYAGTLEALGCICRALLALGQESCCVSRGRTSFKEKRRSKGSANRISVGSFCSTGASTNSLRATKRCSSKNSYRKASPKSKAKDETCSQGCCGKSTAPSIRETCSDKCCDDSVQKPKAAGSNGQSPDLEKGLSGSEHVVLSVSGMTCTGCETKLKRTLAMMEPVRNLKTSLVLARAEFDIDGSGSLEEVMRHLERTTEFKCERITSQGSTLDLLTPGDSTDFVNQAWPDGVTEIKILDRRTAQVNFDAKIVGARDLVENGWTSPVCLTPPRPDPTLDASKKHVHNIGYMTLLSIILTIPVLVMAWAPLPENEIAYASASLALATIVQLVIARPFYPTALKSLVFSKMIEMDLLIVLSTNIAFIFSVVSFGYLAAGQPLSTGQFFETSTLLVTLIMVGRFVSALARQKAIESISIRSLQTQSAFIVNDNGSEQEVDARLLQYGDTFKVAPHSKVPTDGTVISGSSEIDESLVTGESQPVKKSAGSSVCAGSINGSGLLIVRLTRLPDENTISTIARMVDEAKLSKPNIQDLADRVASYFVPIVLILTLITLVVWIAVGVSVRRESGGEAVIQAITYAITVLIVSCPCAIGLAVPMVIVIASGVAAEQGLILKSASTIEVAYKTSHVVFDKTGTLTDGRLSVAKEMYTYHDEGSARSLLLGLVDSIKHPVSAAVATHLEAQGVSASAVSDTKTLTGKGVEGTAAGVTIRAGNFRWLNFSSNTEVQSILSQGYTAFCFTINDNLAATFALEDSVRPDAATTIATLHKRGISAHIVSGDDDGAVQAVATRLNIPASNVRSRCTPADKQAYIQDLLAVPPSATNSKQPKPPVVIFCGDGTNDAVALAQATIGVHMNEGTDVAKAAADAVLMHPSLSGILTLIAVSKMSVNRIRFNFCWSFVYNLVAILLGAGAFVNARIPPEYAGLGELVSVLPVILCAVLMRFSKV